MFSVLLAAALAAADITVTQSDTAVTDAVAHHHGSPVLVQFWATWCDACMKDFPHFLRVAKTPGLKVVSVSVDLKQGLDKHVRPFLDKQDANFSTLLLDVDSPERVMHALDPKWNGSIPASFLYDKDGKLVRRFLGDGGDALDKAVSALISPPPVSPKVEQTTD